MASPEVLAFLSRSIPEDSNRKEPMKKLIGPPRPSILEAKKRWKTWTRGVLSKEALKAEKDGTKWVTLNGVIHVILGFDFVFHVECFVHLGLSKRDFLFSSRFCLQRV